LNGRVSLHECSIYPVDVNVGLPDGKVNLQYGRVSWLIGKVALQDGGIRQQVVRVSMQDDSINL